MSIGVLGPTGWEHRRVRARMGIPAQKGNGGRGPGLGEEAPGRAGLGVLVFSERGVGAVGVLVSEIVSPRRSVRRRSMLELTAPPSAAYLRGKTQGRA